MEKCKDDVVLQVRVSKAVAENIAVAGKKKGMKAVQYIRTMLFDMFAEAA